MTGDETASGAGASLFGGPWFDRAAPALQALAAGVAAVGASYAVAGSSPTFVAAPVAAVVVATTPDVVVTLSITLLGDVGELLALATALGATVAVLGAAAYPGVRLLGGSEGRSSAVRGALVGGLLVGAVSWLLAQSATTPGAAGPAWSAAAAGIGAALVLAITRIVPAGRGDPTGRRAVLAAVGTALGTGILGAALGSRGDSGYGGGPDSGSMDPDAGMESSDGAVGRLLSEADERSLDVEGLEPLVSESFFNVDIAQFDPEIDPDGWTLTVTGNVGEERVFGYDDVTAREPDHRFVSLRCVGDRLNGQKLDNALWTGVPLWDLVAPADPAEDCCVRLHAEDGYYQAFPLEALKRGFLAYRMNGHPLPREHGAPARVLIPGHWGEINVKWVTEVEVLDEAVDGYWEERGWHGTGPVNTVAKLWITNHLPDGRVEVAGHAYAGTRGVDRVEVSTDGGDTWTEATLSEPPPVAGGELSGPSTPVDEPRDDLAPIGRDVWRQWVHRYEPPDGSHDVVVRAVDGTGTVQPRERSNAYPSGATGWVTETVRP